MTFDVCKSSCKVELCSKQFSSNVEAMSKSEFECISMLQYVEEFTLGKR